MTRDDMAREVVDLFVREWDLGHSLEQRCEELFGNLPDPDFDALVEAAETLLRAESYRATFGVPYDASRKPPGYHVHTNRKPPIFEGESYDETARKDGVG